VQERLERMYRNDKRFAPGMKIQPIRYPLGSQFRNDRGWWSNPYRFILAPSGTSSLNRSIGSLETQAKARSTTMRNIGSSKVQL
jgi:hypothetical protein